MTRKFYFPTFGFTSRKIKFSELTEKGQDTFEAIFDRNTKFDDEYYGQVSLSDSLIRHMAKKKCPMCQGEIKDILNDQFGELMIISSKMWDVIKPYVQDHARAIPAPFYFEKTDKSLGYVFLDPLVRCQAMYEEGIGKDCFTIDLDRIPINVHVFRISCRGRSNSSILVSSQVKEAIMEAKLTGIDWISTWTKEEYQKVKSKPVPKQQLTKTRFYIPDVHLCQEFEHDEYISSINYKIFKNEETFIDYIERAKKIPKAIYAKASFILRKGSLTDYLANHDDSQYCILSKRYFNLIRHLVTDHVQVIELDCCYEGSNEKAHDYVLINPLTRIDATSDVIDPRVPGVIIDEKRIPKNIHVLRIHQKGNDDDCGHIVFSKELKYIFAENRFRGIRWLNTYCGK